MNNRKRIEKAAALASRVAGQLNLSLATGKMNGAVKKSCIASLDEAQQLLTELEGK